MEKGLSEDLTYFQLEIVNRNKIYPNISFHVQGHGLSVIFHKCAYLTYHFPPERGSYKTNNCG